jgi:hypothetical protein
MQTGRIYSLSLELMTDRALSMSIVPELCPVETHRRDTPSKDLEKDYESKDNRNKKIRNLL